MNKFFYVKNKITSNYIKHTICFLGIKFSFKKHITLKGSPIVLQVASNYTASNGIACKVISNEKEHKQNIDALKKGLSTEALNNLNRILNRTNKIIKAAKSNMSFENENIYSKDELMELEKVHQMTKEITEKDGYFEYKDYKLPIKLFSSSVFVYKHGIDTLKTTNNLKDKVILDVGSCVGDSILIFRKYFNNPIIGFEPVKKTFELANKTLELNNITNAKIENLGLGAKEEKIEMQVFPDNPDWATVESRISENKEIISVKTLDSYVKEHNLKVGMIKVDIEGFEPYFLQGAINTIKEQKPIILLSIYHCYNDFYKLKPWIENLNLGYKFNFFKGIDGDPVGETLLICEVY